MARRDKGAERRIARGRIQRLWQAAEGEALQGDGDLADRYAGLAHRIALRYQQPWGAAGKLRRCPGCHEFRVPGRNTRTRIQRGRVITSCLACGHVRRRPLGQEAA